MRYGTESLSPFLNAHQKLVYLAPVTHAEPSTCFFAATDGPFQVISESFHANLNSSSSHSSLVLCLDSKGLLSCAALCPQLQSHYWYLCSASRILYLCGMPSVSSLVGNPTLTRLFGQLSCYFLHSILYTGPVPIQLCPVVPKHSTSQSWRIYTAYRDIFQAILPVDTNP